MGTVLSSWKEIASYLGKGVRTVQRWEREMGLPVRRPKGKRSRVVLAHPEELRRWAGRKDQLRVTTNGTRDELRRMAELAAQMHSRTVELQKRMDRLHAEMQQAILSQGRQQARPRSSARTAA